jgi:hypothetical protein
LQYVDDDEVGLYDREMARLDAAEIQDVVDDGQQVLGA